MQKNQQTQKDQNKENITPVPQKEEQKDKEKNENERISNNSKKDNPETKEKDLELKSQLLNKPKELLGFDAVPHFKENINHTDKNCLEPITEKSYYCLDCKHSKCPLYKENINQKDHLLIKRAKCLFYDENFFDSVENSINEALNYNQLKINIKETFSNSINSLKDELEKLKEKKFQEIDNFFEETDKYLLELKDKYNNVKKSIEDYYNKNKKFFNIQISKEINNENENINDLKEKKITKSELINNDNNIEDNNINSDDTINTNDDSNRDIENTVFLLNFELMNLCETKNLEVINMLKDLKKRIELFNPLILNELPQNIEIVSKFFNIDIKSEKIDDYYWDIVSRTKKYTEMIQHFRETITDILHHTKSLEKIKDLINIFDSKLKKNNKVIFEQNYFKENNNNNETNTKHSRGYNSPTERSRKRNPSFSTARSNSKSKLYSQRGKSASKLKKNPKPDLIRNNYGPLTLSNDFGLNLQQNKNENLKTETGSSPLNTHGNLEHKKTTPNSIFNKFFSYRTVVPEDIILNQRVLQRFFAYSISELFSKNFAPIDLDNISSYSDSYKDNIYYIKDKSKRSSLKESLNTNNLNNNNNSQNNKLKNTRGHSSKKNKNMNYSSTGNKYNNYNTYNNNYGNLRGGNILSNLKNTVGFNNANNNIYNNINMNLKNNLGKSEEEKFDNTQYNVKSVSYLANYTNRYNSLKEVAKPIIGTNQIQLFSPHNHKIIRKTTNLNREEHGYSLFPEGCRHILVDDNLYIIGGTNHVRIPISIVLVYNVSSGSLRRLPDLNTAHSYHTVDYLENYDSIICIGGENSASCEIMNLDNKKWYKLPNLNIPRANCNIYLNNVNGELFVLFGICGLMNEKTNYSDSIEVLVLNDISQGWIKIDYYKTPGLNLKVNYCMTIPFTRNQLLIYGGSNMRSFRQNIYALFHMIRNECNKVDPQTMELIKLEEKKSRLVDLALTKLG